MGTNKGKCQHRTRGHSATIPTLFVPICIFKKMIDKINMKIIGLITSLILLIFFENCQNKLPDSKAEYVIGKGEMPNMVTDRFHTIHLVYGSGDSIMYSYSSDIGKTFSSPTLISVLPKLVASHTRGPQIAVTSEGLLVSACNALGDIFSFAKDRSGKWSRTARVNDVDTVAKEGFTALTADGQNAFAIWLDLRGDRHNKIFGSRSSDGGKTWSKNYLIYASPDSTVCECCKPSVAMKGKDVYVMFRNWLNGDRDLYFVHSQDGGNSFGDAKKIGKESWKINGCPMDGGGIAIDKSDNLQTVWNRKGVIYACEGGKEEKPLGRGRSCSIETESGKNIYTWVHNGNVVVMGPDAVKHTVGEGQLPLVKAVGRSIICIWENNGEIHRVIL